MRDSCRGRLREESYRRLGRRTWLYRYEFLDERAAYTLKTRCTCPDVSHAYTGEATGIGRLCCGAQLLKYPSRFDYDHIFGLHLSHSPAFTNIPAPSATPSWHPAPSVRPSASQSFSGCLPNVWVWITALFTVLTFLLVMRVFFRDAYAQYVGIFYGDSTVLSFIFPSLTGVHGLWRWSHVGNSVFHVEGPGFSKHVKGWCGATARHWFLIWEQPVTLDRGDEDFPLLRPITYGFPRVAYGEPSVVSQISESNDAACLFHSDTNTLEMAWLCSPRSFSIPADAYRAAAARYRLATTKAYGVVAVALQSVTRDENVVAMAMSLIGTGVTYGTCDLPDLNNQPLYRGGFPEDARPMGIRSVSNVVYAVEGFGQGAPMISLSTERDTIHRRIAEPRSTYTGDDQTIAYAEEFLQYVCGNVNLQPCDADRVCEQMDRPSQRSNRLSVDTIMDLLPKSVKQLFTKREPVPIGKPARNICTVSPQRLFRAARFTLAASDHMQKFCWWVWGAGSGATARKYQASCSLNERMQESDFSKFDASLGPFWLWFNREFMFRLFPSHRDELDMLLRDSEWQAVSTTLRQTFNYGCGRFSGVNETTLFNTLDQAFVQYTSFRRYGYSVDRAVSIIEQSLFGGDDGITPYLGQDLPASASVFGMKVTYRVFRNCEPCRFLGRIYISGASSADSVHDIADWLSSVHLVSCAGNVSTAQALVNAATGMWVTDSKTPLIREFCQSVFRAYPHLSKNIGRNDEWWFKHYDTSDPFPLQDYADDTIILAHFATVMGVDAAGLYALRDWFTSNPFFVGSRLPTLEIEFRPSLKCAFQIYGIPFGAPAEPPPLPRFTRREVRDAISGVPDNASAPDVDISQSKPLFGADDCFLCGLSGHFSASCPSRVTCRLCGVTGHEAKSCTSAEERAASEMLEGMGFGHAAAPLARARKGAGRRRKRDAA